MANFLHKLLKNPSHRKIITCFNHQNSPIRLVPPLLHQPNINPTKLQDDCYPNPEVDFQAKEKLTQYNKLQIYPSFPFGFCLNPISAYGFDPSQMNRADWFEPDVSSMVWADSVKKKRKKKMNKHKYKKLRKRLRRKT